MPRHACGPNIILPVPIFQLQLHVLLISCFRAQTLLFAYTGHKSILPFNVSLHSQPVVCLHVMQHESHVAAAMLFRHQAVNCWQCVAG